MNTLGLILNIVGITLLFIGNMEITKTIGKWDARKLKEFKRGNRMQGVGFGVSLLAIFVTVL